MYSRLLAGVVRAPVTADWAEPAWHLYAVRLENRDGVLEALAAEGILAGIHYPLPLHLQPALTGLGYREGDFPVTEEWSRMLLSLPLFAELTLEEVERVANAVTARVGVRA